MILIFMLPSPMDVCLLEQLYGNELNGFLYRFLNIKYLQYSWVQLWWGSIYYDILYIVLQTLVQNIHQFVFTKDTPYLASRVSFWVSVVRILETIDRVIMLLHCILYFMFIQHKRGTFYDCTHRPVCKILYDLSWDGLEMTWRKCFW